MDVYVHDARVAERRGDLPQLAFLIGQMAEAIVAVAEARHGELGIWAKRSPRGLAAEEELALVEDALRAPGRRVGRAGPSALLVAGCSAEELRAVLAETNYRRFTDYGPLGRYVGATLNSFRRRGYCPGRYFRGWLSERLEAKLGKPNPTFADVARADLPADLSPAQRERARYRLRVIASDVTSGSMIVLPDDIESYADERCRQFVKDEFLIVEAVRMSMSYPFVFEPVVLYRDGRRH